MAADIRSRRRTIIGSLKSQPAPASLGDGERQSETCDQKGCLVLHWKALLNRRTRV
jgi:hypothetical protein